MFAACSISPEKLEFEKAEQKVQAKEFAAALKHYEIVVDRYVKTDYAIKAAKAAAQLNHYEIKNYPRAIELYKHVVLYSLDADERLDAQKKITDIYFNNIQDYTQSVTEFNRLLELKHSPEEEGNYRLSLARSYFYLSNFYQAEVEVEALLKQKHRPEQVFDALLLKANIYLTSKKLDSAIVVLKELMERYPERSQSEKIGLVLAVTYEEQKNFAKAIETLQAIKDTYPRKEFIERRIKALRERQMLLPGARGLKK